MSGNAFAVSLSADDILFIIVSLSGMAPLRTVRQTSLARKLSVKTLPLTSSILGTPVAISPRL